MTERPGPAPGRSAFSGGSRDRDRRYGLRFVGGDNRQAFGHIVERDRLGSRNPRTGEAIPIKARNVVTFHASHKLKTIVQGDAPAAEDFE